MTTQPDTQTERADIAAFIYRIKGDALTIGYKLDRPDDTLRTAFADVVKTIGESITQPVLNGTPA